jgi:hypothetical protein
MNEAASRAVTVFNVFTPKGEEFTEVDDMQNAVPPRFHDQVPGLLGSCLYTSVDNKTAVLMSVWEKLSDFEQFRDSGMLPRLSRSTERGGVAVGICLGPAV